MKLTLKTEEAMMLTLSLLLFNHLPYSWWLFAALFLTPDLSMLGYLVNAKVGAISYNIVHHKGIALVIYAAGLYINSSVLQFAGLLLFAHSSFDRMLGYGLKYSDSFNHTHLGFIGKPKSV
jgi:hypothetical protein